MSRKMGRGRAIVEGLLWIALYTGVLTLGLILMFWLLGVR